jgi:inner membrane protein
MDTLTHIVLGACIGEVIAGKQLGKKALLLGAVAQNIPDIDFIASAWLPVANDLVAHRGFTHSFLFTALITPLLAFVSARWWRSSGMDFRRWMLFWGVQIFIHLFIDAFNAYGTGWFIPFSSYRVSFNTMYVADPLFSIWLAIAMVALLLIKRSNRQRLAWAKAGLLISSLYWLAGIGFKLYIDTPVRNNLRDKKIVLGHYFTTPTPLNNLLWNIVAENDSGYYIGYRSVFDQGKEIDFHYVYRNDSLLRHYQNTNELTLLKQFSQGYYAAALWHDTLVFNIPRFGEMNGWALRHPRFAFYYYMQYPENNKLVIQRGRFEGWDKHTWELFLRRIEGYPVSLR